MQTKPQKTTKKIVIKEIPYLTQLNTAAPTVGQIVPTAAPVSATPATGATNTSHKKQRSTRARSLMLRQSQFATMGLVSQTQEPQQTQNIVCDKLNMYIPECNEIILRKEYEERDMLDENQNSMPSYIYPSLNDPNFNIKIALKNEFSNTKYDGRIHKDVKEYADKLSNAEFEIAPHQVFVRNFLSQNTPYNSALLFWTVGSGKTCAAIGVAEEVRDMMRNLGIKKKIMIIASENVQENFMLQIFDERKLKFVDGKWEMNSCLGNKLLHEINPTNMKGLTIDKIITMIKTIIRNYYVFLGYGQFANYIRKIITGKNENKNRKENIDLLQITPQVIKALQQEFSGRLLIIDEVHNIRKSEENEGKKVALFLELLVKYVRNMKLLFLSATPMFNNYKEIIWILNIMNINDNRAKVRVSDIFNLDGSFREGGEELLMHKATGYISYVRGENPYTFPYRIYPEMFAKDHTFKVVPYPDYQMNLRKIKKENKKRILDVYINFMENCSNSCGSYGCQYCYYKYIINYLRNKSFNQATKNGAIINMPSFENMEAFGYNILQKPLEALIITYPIENMAEIIANIDQNYKVTYVNEDENIYGDDGMKATATTAVTEAASSMKIIAKETRNLALVDKQNKEDDDLDNIDVDLSKISASIDDGAKLGNNSIADDDGEDEGEDEGISDADDVAVNKDLFVYNPNILTGKTGLHRLLTYNTSKDKYEYKPETIKKYGRIFREDIIGKYSIKIKTVLDFIKKGEGIILVYSQYIYGGLIPMALALEEMGFVRYADAGNPAKDLLVRDPQAPSQYIDVRTMSPPVDKKNFKPARYVMITGEIRLSPNSINDVKALTNDANLNGENIKVILISKAGAEGIDLKYIRQIHILEPWYNMNRIEQIIGRGVRNFSHKLLPFEKRNVEIFMHGTIIKDSVEEAADLYVYRVAELKGIQIGNVTRLLKQTAVDCVLNHGQLNYTQENMDKYLNEPIEQKLSTGEVIEDFKIGDAPFSSLCDYMPTCNYSCAYDVEKFKNAQISMDTYNEYYIYLNYEKISQKLKLLMKKEYFYTKQNLIKELQEQGDYPLIQIYAVLSDFIEDKENTIIDKYGRIGYLENIGDYYLFIPQELINKKLSIFERMRPVDFKNVAVNFNIDLNLLNKIKNITSKMHISLYKNINDDMATTIYKKYKNLYDIVKYELNNTSLMSIVDNTPPNDDNEFDEGIVNEDEDWYHNCGKILRRMYLELGEGAVEWSWKNELTKDKILELFVEHLLDKIILFEEKYVILNYIYKQDKLTNNYDIAVREYFELKVFYVNFSNVVKEKILLFYNYELNKKIYMKYNEHAKEWIKLDLDDVIQYGLDDIAKKNMIITLGTSEPTNGVKYNSHIGFTAYVFKIKALVFKLLNLMAPRDVGYICYQAGKKKLIDNLNKLLGVEFYTKENTKIFIENGKQVKFILYPKDLCIIQEFLMRFYNNIKYNDVRWIVSPEAALINDLYKIFNK